MAANVLFPLLIPLGEQITNGTGNLYFSKPAYEIHVHENTAPIDLLQLEARSNITAGNVSYRLIGGSLNDTFSTDSRTGILKLNSPLDYEAKNMYELVVGAQVGQEKAFGRVVLKVHDVNDQPPFFERPLYETQMTEEDDRHLPKRILQVSASDGDVSDQKKLCYYLSGDGTLEVPIKKNSILTIGASLMPETLPYFDINATNGVIQLLRPLDRDAPNGRAKWVLDVGVTDGKYDAHTVLHVNVKDINDNAPFFSQVLLEGSVLENSPQGSEVITVNAIDLDDPNEGEHAIFSYSLEKNVIDEKSGRPIFSIDHLSGRISTALCCLDREKTSFYAIQVVATDGGGLKGTGSVLVTVDDENDVAPRFPMSEWTISVHETSPLNTSLALIPVTDPDLSNNFTFKIIPNSGYGWDRFAVVPYPPDSGSLIAVKELDFEDPEQRQGFTFKIQVTDRINSNKEFTDSLHASVTLIDDNDNEPKLEKDFKSLELYEDTPEGTTLTRFTATDADNSGVSNLFYTILSPSDPHRHFQVDSTGKVVLNQLLDREKTSEHLVKILAIDEGTPACTATATLQITVKDINDNTPFIKSPKAVFLKENSPPRQLTDIVMDDLDDWSLGNGPPFIITLDGRASVDIIKSFSVRYEAEGDEGRGIGILRSLVPLDREEGAEKHIPLILKDNKGLSSTVTLTVTVTDLNDNPMAPGSKIVNVTRIKNHFSNIPLGRIYVEDLDDWDSKDKTWEWMNNKPEPLFHLDQQLGFVSVSPKVSDNEYFLRFKVSDKTHHQENISANMTVHISTLEAASVVKSAVPILITSHSPQQLIKQGNNSVSPLEKLLEVASIILDLHLQVLTLEERNVIKFSSKPNMAKLIKNKEIIKLDKKSRILTDEDNKYTAVKNPLNVSYPNEKNFKRFPMLRPKTRHFRNMLSTVHKLTPKEFTGRHRRSENRTMKLQSMKETDHILSEKHRPKRKNNGQPLIENYKTHFSSEEVSQNRVINIPTTLWVTSDTRRPLDQLLLINRDKISKASGVRISDVGFGICAQWNSNGYFPIKLRHNKLLATSETDNSHKNFYRLSEKEKRTTYRNDNQFWVIDSNKTALVTPKVKAGVGCSCQKGKLNNIENIELKTAQTTALKINTQPLQVKHLSIEINSCHPDPCLNGGRCISAAYGPKCICPERTSDPTCKQLSRHFRPGGWAWVNPIPSCSYAHISLEFVTVSKSGLLLYTGPAPDTSHPSHVQHPLLQGDILSLKIVDGLPRLQLDIKGSSVTLMPRLSVSYSKKENLEISTSSGTKRKKIKTESNVMTHISDGKWHRLDILWGDEQVELLIDLCQTSFENCHIKASLPILEEELNFLNNSTKKGRHLPPRTPLQLGGLAYSTGKKQSPLEAEKLNQMSFDGCIRNLRVNGRLYDLGKDLLSHKSEAGCEEREFCIEKDDKKCSSSKRCIDGVCECLPGWTGDMCNKITIPSTFEQESYVKVALSFQPLKNSTSLQLRFRSWSSVGHLIILSSQHAKDQMSLFLDEGKLCLMIALQASSTNGLVENNTKSKPSRLCLTNVPVNDGQWHTAYAKRYGRWLELYVDSGEWPLYNASLTLSMSMHSKLSKEIPAALLKNFTVHQQRQMQWGSVPFILDKQEGIYIGGVPEYISTSLQIPKNNFFNGCIDDVRLNGRFLPLPPQQNTTQWAQSSAFGGRVTSHCSSLSECKNVTCPEPLVCIDLWRKHHCGCPPGKELTSDSLFCNDVNECIWQPCLNQGTCYNRDPGYSCSCQSGFIGSNCELRGVNSLALPISMGLIAGIIVWFLVFFIVITMFIVRQKRKKKANQDPTESPDRRSSFPNENESSGLSKPSFVCPNPKLMEMEVLDDIPIQPISDQMFSNQQKEVLRVAGLQSSWPKLGWLFLHKSFSARCIRSKKSCHLPIKSVSPSISNNESFCQTRTDIVNLSRIEEVNNEKKSESGDLNRNSDKSKKICISCDKIFPIDDLRCYAYEGDGTTPGSLSSCCSGCSNSNQKGTDKIVEGFQEVAMMLNCLTNDKTSNAKWQLN